MSFFKALYFEKEVFFNLLPADSKVKNNIYKLISICAPYFIN